MSSVSSTSSISPHYSHHRTNQKRPKSGIKSTVIGKAPHQVERRNARERRRVQNVNQGYEDLAKQIADWEELKDKKLTKAETLKAAILYIQHLEDLLSEPQAISSSTSSSSPSSNSSSIFIKNEQPHSIKSESMSYDQQIRCHQSRQFQSIQTSNSMPSNYTSPTYAPYFNPINSTNGPLNLMNEYGNENHHHFLMHYDFNSSRYS